jgi:hypothetical protein
MIYFYMDHYFIYLGDFDRKSSSIIFKASSELYFKAILNSSYSSL